MKMFIFLYCIFLNIAVASNEKLSNQILNLVDKDIKDINQREQNKIDTNNTINELLETEIKKLKIEVENLKWNIKQCESEKSKIKEDFILNYYPKIEKYKQEDDFNQFNDFNKYKTKEGDYIKPTKKGKNNYSQTY